MGGASLGSTGGVCGAAHLPQQRSDWLASRPHTKLLPVVMAVKAWPPATGTGVSDVLYAKPGLPSSRS